MSKRCCTQAGLLTARRIVRGYMFDAAELRRIYNWHLRHRAAARNSGVIDPISKRAQAMMLWGGEPMFRYSQRIIRKLDAGKK